MVVFEVVHVVVRDRRLVGVLDQLAPLQLSVLLEVCDVRTWD